MADNLQQGELGRQILTAITQHVSADTNYWGEFEQMNTESLINAAKACEKIILSLRPEQFQTEQTMDISIRFATWMQQEGRTGNWKENYEYFLQKVYVYQPQSATLKNADQPPLLTQLKKAK
jgi:hypothetical protein